MSGITKMARYSGGDVACVLRAACLLALLRPVLRIRPGYVLRGRLRVANVRRPAPSPAQVVRAVRFASRLVGGSCLARALVSRVLLARAGVPVALVVGAADRSPETPLRAHAWIEHRGLPVVHGEPAPAFPAVWRLAPPALR